jgi:WhiB family transcriptional regulator, redox-sensing transcriptional regulator
MGIDCSARGCKASRAMIKEQVLLEDQEWREHASCLHFSAVLFFGFDDSESPAEKRLREDQAKTVCLECPVRQECLDYAISARESHGIWGGMTDVERRRFANRSR